MKAISNTRQLRNDSILLGGLLVIALVWYCIVYRNGISKDKTVVITVNGEVAGRYLLSENRKITIDNQYGTNVIAISNGQLYVETADCNGNDCVKHAPVSKGNEAIICLPHKLAITITDSVSEGFDAITE